MTQQEWLQLMRFPTQWSDWSLVPEALVAELVTRYVPGQENSPEHDRHGLFQWWLRQEPPSEVLVKLARLTWLDPDPQMGAYVRECIAKQCVDPEVASALAHNCAA